ncbi:hypothetical protein ACIGFK_18475 [Streptomyces sp. NPDC085524]|uniref:hypothetical protein n=1 Tax=unclassified Streptomyces TaxID=2593676 RepID=UPI0035D5686D
MHSTDPLSLPDQTDGQIQTLISTEWERVKTSLDGIGPVNEYYVDGGYDHETWNRVFYGLLREPTGSMTVATDPAHPSTKGSGRAVRETAGIPPRGGGAREALQHHVGQGVRLCVLAVGQHRTATTAKYRDEPSTTVLGPVWNAEPHRCPTSETAG